MISQLKWWNKVDSISRSVITASCGGKSWKKGQLSWRSKCWCYNKIERRYLYIFDMAPFLMSNLLEIVSAGIFIFHAWSQYCTHCFLQVSKVFCITLSFGFIFDTTQVWKHIKVTTEHLEPVKQSELKIWLKFQLGPKVLAKFDQNLWKCSKD